MALAAGTTFGPYEVIALVGAGGMGEVYRARDTRLGREVALKTLPAALARDADRLRRFENEARAASLLSHPNILAVYDVGTVEDRPFLVSELLEGETLRERLSRGPLPPRKSLEIAGAAAAALAEAHQRGIVHRDLKPENLFLTRDGRLKILDFGIAKLTSPDPIKGISASTVQLITELGTAVGTPGYMAPEQVRGEPVDHRSDIFALGAILQEMLTGTAVFQRDSRIATLNAVLESTPPDLPESLPPALRRIVQRCLEKHADERFQSARDLAFALNALSDVSVSTAAGVSFPFGVNRKTRWGVAALVSVATIAVAGAMALNMQSTQTPSPRAIKRFAIQPSARFYGLHVSPDGSLVAYVSREGAVPQIQLRPFDRLEPQPLEGSQGANMPVFSPDGKWVAFTVAGKLKKLPISGGTPITLCDAPEYLSASWSENGHIFFAQRESGIRRVSAEGGVSELITTVDVAGGELDHHSPSLLPGGKALLFTIHAGPEVFRIVVRSLETGQQRTLVEDGFEGQYLPTGHLVYAREDTLYAAPFDLSRLEITGPAVPVLERVLTVPYNGFANIQFANDGTVTFLPAIDLTRRSLVWVNRDGTSQPLPTPERAYDYPALSPDGNRLAVKVATGGEDNIWVYDFATDSLNRVTFGGVESKPIWTPDGKRVTYAVRRGAERHLFMQALHDSAPAEDLYRTRQDVWPGAWTADGQSLVFVETPPTEIGDIKILSIAKRPAAEPLVASENAEFYPSLSPDGHWLAYVVLGPRAEVYIRPVRGGAPRQISTDGGTHPRWSRAGREVFYRRGASMMAVSVQTTPELKLSKPATLFEGAYVLSVLGPPSYDVTPDGRRFVMIKASADELAMRPIHVILNWFDELKRRVPTGR